MNRRSFIEALGGTALATAAGPGSAAPRRKPNIIAILCDDLGYGDIAPYGNTVLRTPALSRLAAEGTVLTDYYAPHNICTQSRAGFLTGRYPIRAKITEGAIEPEQLHLGLPLSDVTIAEALKPDYATAFIGKWHLGHGPDFWPPNRQGFDYFYGIPYSHDMSPLSVFESRSIRADAVIQSDVDYPNLQGDFCRRAERFISDNHDRPFFVELALSSPHLPNFPDKAHALKSKVGYYGDVVEEIDTLVGRLLALVERLGLTRDTLFVFTSDNGPWFEGSAGPLRERKAQGGFDGASRVPFIARMPGTVLAGRRSNAIASGLDVLPTLCTIAGAPVPAGVDGIDISAVLTRGAASPHDELVLFNADDVVAVRTQRWSYVAGAYFQGAFLNLETRGYPQLYDMAADPSQNYSAASLHPEVVADMKRRLQRARARFEPLRNRPTRIVTPPSTNEKPAIFRD